MDDKQRNSLHSSDNDLGTASTNNIKHNQSEPVDESAAHHKPYYYAYGPYQSKMQERDVPTTASTHLPKQDLSDVQITTPQALKDGWHFKSSSAPSRTSFKVIFISFIGCIIIIIALMIIADRTNLFTDDPELSIEKYTNPVVEEKEALSHHSGTPFPNGVYSVAGVVKKVSPAVVKIETFTAQKQRGQNRFWDDPLFQQFFGDRDLENNSSPEEAPSKLQPLGAGTGFIYDKRGYILTNQHVVEDGELIQVTIEGYKEPMRAQLLGHNKDLDLAVLKIKGKQDFHTVTLGNSDKAQVGDFMVAIGNPSGLDRSVTVGVLSAREREVPIVDGNYNVHKYEHLLQTDASINPGNSGGPLLNMRGEVIGMNVAVSKRAQGIGFAIPTNRIKKVVSNLQANREIPKPFIGITLELMTQDKAKEMGIKPIKGVRVREVEFNSPAYDADIRGYDIITSIDGITYEREIEYVEHIRKKDVGSKVSLRIVRKNKVMDVQVKIGNRNKR